MNKLRRKRLAEIVERMNACLEDLENLKDEEESAFDNLPESLQESPRGEAMQEAVDTMEDGVTDLELLVESLGELADGE